MRYLIRERAIAVRDGFSVTGEAGRDVLRVDGEGQPSFDLLALAAGGALEAHGDITEKEFEIRSGDAVRARVSRAWLKVRHSYGVDVAPGQDDPLLLTVALCVDRLHHDEVARRHR